MNGPPAPTLGAPSFGECYCGDPLTLDHECYYWPPKACDCQVCRRGTRISLPYVRALWQDRQDQAARLAAVAALKSIYPLSHGSDASGVVPCFDRYDYDAMRGISYVTLRESDWKRIQAAVAATGAVGAGEARDGA